MRFLIELGRRIHWWWLSKPTESEYVEDYYSVKCILCGFIQDDEVCVECNSESWVKKNPDFNQ